jgi:hypothetical protein
VGRRAGAEVVAVALGRKKIDRWRRRKSIRKKVEEGGTTVRCQRTRVR